MAKDLNKLDITDYRLKVRLNNEMARDELIDHIYKEVMGTQSFIIRPYPSLLVVTQEQFDILKPTAETSPHEGMIWRTMHPRTGEIISMMDIFVKGVYEPERNMILLT